MLNCPTRLKVCGLTSATDAQEAAETGAAYLGFIFYPKSPRALTMAQFGVLKAGLPAGPKRVAVVVEPGLAEITAAQQAGFDFIQIHFKTSTPLAQVREWSELITPARLWLAPKLPPETDLSPLLLSLADTFLLDTYHAEKFGGTGETGDWAKFRRHLQAHPDKTWILSGGLTAENLAEAVARSGAEFVDLNSGLESSPGVKDHGKLRQLAAVLKR